MIHTQGAKYQLMTPVTVVTAQTATMSVDTLGYEYASFDVFLDSQASTTSNPSVLKLGEGSISNVSSATDITAFVGDGVGGFTIPPAGGATGTLVCLNVDLKARDRYLTLTVSPAGTNQIVGAICRLTRANEHPDTTTEAGVTALING